MIIVHSSILLLGCQYAITGRATQRAAGRRSGASKHFYTKDRNTASRAEMRAASVTWRAKLNHSQLKTVSPLVSHWQLDTWICDYFSWLWAFEHLSAFQSEHFAEECKCWDVRLFDFFQSIRWEDFYHSHVCTLVYGAGARRQIGPAWHKKMVEARGETYYHKNTAQIHNRHLPIEYISSHFHTWDCM